MGCDGGTIPRRDELVRVKKKPEQKDKDSEREFRWRHCALTQQKLQEPIAMCGLGRLYSKQNVIERLLEKEKMPEIAQHVRNMKDIKTLSLTPNPAFNAEEDKTEGLLDTRHAPYICKLIGLEMSGKFRFVALWSCGCVMSERALKQIKSTSSICPLCQTPFSVEDVIVLNGNDEDIELMQAKIEMRSAKRKNSKKEKKEKKVTSSSATEVSSTSSSATEVSSTLSSVDSAKALNQEDDTVVKKIKVEDGPSTSKNAGVAAVRTGITSKPPNAHKTKLLNKRIGSSTNSLQDPEIKRLKTEYSVANDPKATDVYKSLFTSHKTEKEQERAHWVTYNPFYN